MEIRKATRDDNSALLELAKATPQEGIITLLSDQSPDFFKILDLMGDGYTIWVAEDQGRIMGCIGEFEKKVNYGGKEIVVYYVGELKVHPSARGMVGIALARHLIKKMDRKRYSFAEGFILDGNEKSQKMANYFMDKFSEKIDVGHVVNYQLIPFKNYKINPSYTIRDAAEADLPKVAKLLQETYKDYYCAPTFSEERLKKEFSRSDTFTIKDMKVAEENGEIVACAGFWDQSSIRKNIALRFSLPIKLVVNAVKVLGKFFCLPYPPKEGGLLKYEFVRFLGAKPEKIEALQAIIQNYLNDAKKERELHFLWASFHVNDSLKAVAEKMTKMSAKTTMFHAKIDEDFQVPSAEKLEKAAFYVDFSII